MCKSPPFYPKCIFKGRLHKFYMRGLICSNEFVWLGEMHKSWKIIPLCWYILIWWQHRTILFFKSLPCFFFILFFYCCKWHTLWSISLRLSLAFSVTKCQLCETLRGSFSHAYWKPHVLQFYIKNLRYSRLCPPPWHCFHQGFI